jgi:hypothetical protein
VVAFAGPSVPPAARDRFPQVEWRPPAQAGDLLALGPRPELTVCLIDGYFDHRPAVRHKEILWLLADGVRLVGGASMGALRAAEMRSFGMEGAGAIYRAFACGRLVRDDEVALIHGPEERGWLPLSVALVDVRAALCGGMRRGLVSAGDARAVLASAKGCHYADRLWPEVLARAPVPQERLCPLAEWVSAERPSLKRTDAEACLAAALAPAVPLNRPQGVRTAFLDALARERGLALAPMPQAPLPSVPAPIRAASPETAGDRKPSRGDVRR